jgi:phage terminase large subunit GpA-like protein
MAKPPPKLTVSQWADEHRILSPESSAEPGQWRTSRAPYLREIMDCLSPSSTVERVVMMTSSQVAKTETLNNACGYYIHQEPGPILVVQPTTEMGKAWSKDRLAPMLRDSPALAGQVGEARSRDSENTLLHKKFTGGHITIVGANAPSGLASRPIRFVFLDEVDRYPLSAGAEGDPISLAVKRSATFWNRKIFICSTPTLQGRSRIEAEFQRSDQRHYWVPCPDCREFQKLRWPQVKFREVGLPPEEAVYACAHCGSLIPSHRKAWMLTRGEWRAEAPGDNKPAGFHLNELYSPWRSFGDTAVDFLAAKGSPNTLRTWINTALGEAYEERGEAPEFEKLMLKREDYPVGIVPDGALILTGMADVQKDRLEWAIYGWGCGESLEGWLVDRGIIYGDPEKDDQVWRDLAEVSQRQFDDGHDGSWSIDAMGVDSGFLSNRVYQFCRNRPRVFATDGRPGWQRPMIDRPKPVDINWAGKRIERGVLLWPLGTFSLKVWVYAALRSVLDGNPKLHFPQDCDAEFFQQITAEYLAEVEKKSGLVDREWRLLKNRPNEQLDLVVGARAMAAKLGVDRWTPAHWDEVRARRRPVSEPEPEIAPDPPPPKQPQQPPQPTGRYPTRRSAWMQR